MRKIAVLTVARSDYGILRPVLRELMQRKGVQLQLIVAGSHFSTRYGRTVDEIEEDGVPIAWRIDASPKDDRPQSIAAAMGEQVNALSEAFASLQSDFLVLMGDRFEMLAGAVAFLPFNRPIAHIHGGEASFGAIDDSMRHAITKLSHLHFPATAEYAARIRQMGEQEDRIAVSGAPGLDNIRNLDLPSPDAIADRFGFAFDSDRPPILVTFHPETRSAVSPEKQIETVLDAISKMAEPLLFTMPNADAGGLAIAAAIKSFCEEHTEAAYADHLGTANYFGMLKVAPAMIGNSSSGIIEAASFGLPVVNIGDRQKGRACGPNVLHVPLEKIEIERAVSKALTADFRNHCAGMDNIYGDGQAAHVIADILENTRIDDRFLAKEFSDLPAHNTGVN